MNDLINQIDKLISEKNIRPIIITIDGRCGAGKTTLAEKLKTKYNTSVISMDDFFLPVELRSENRLNEPGGNIHYERFKEEVVRNVRSGKVFTYGKFNCRVMKCDSVIKVNPADIIVVEGSYSNHPYFGYYSDIRIFCDISPDEQFNRIITRDGAQKAEMFARCWIPLEEKYFSAFRIKEFSDIVVS